ncbi:hypothetical protein H0H81_003149 [Sphagnurus paluster]|uniref:DDE Tnp4 domain-containing protein n=1 Tax=Sphagnurus paluster TaxID=117069 RepID=A0A9P7K1F5_9AGAR|nr:hypothetical protein H0H81_003149 [Sphagnurus paluster]
MRVCVKSEHAMGYIKGQFCSLRGLQQQVDDATDDAWATAWIKTCIVLHTLIFIIKHGNKDPEFVEDLIKEGQDPVEKGAENEITAEATRKTQGQRMRLVLKQKLFEHLANIGEY